MHAFGEGFPEYFRDVGIAIAPIIAFFIVFQVIFLKLPKTQLLKMAVGMAYTYIGLVLFLTGVNVGFMPVGNYLGAQIGSLDYNWMLIPLGMIMGFFVVMAEPAVHLSLIHISRLRIHNFPLLFLIWIIYTANG